MANEKVLGLVSGTRDGKLLVVTTPTRCDDPVADEVYMGLVSGTRNGKPLVAISTQRCGGTGLLETDRGYLGLVSGTRNGKLLLAVPCGDCDGGDMPVCGGCNVCCTLSATLQLPDPGTGGTTFGTAFDVELFCNRSFEIWKGATQCYYFNEETEEGDSYYVDQGVTTYSGTSGVVTIEDVEYTYVSDIWASDEFTYGGATYKLVLSVETRDYINPMTELPSQSCGFYLQLLKYTEFASPPIYDFGFQWCSIAKVINATAPAAGPESPWFNVVADPDVPCTPPYEGIDTIGCGAAGCIAGPPGYNTYNMDQDFDGVVDCPIYMEDEHPAAPFTPKCWKVQLFDLCEE